ncbi:trypsin inhibitor-like [Ptiloglossa arizonensis]|uniref:trypsin inhibitor-like n=1 Tax=Ptiloglossa arizonensis TaxID=3350558 RepID=UPI003FA0CC15
MGNQTFSLLLLTLLALDTIASASIGPQCLLPLVRGPCRGLLIRYGYNLHTNRCEEFTYGGCSGNENSFDSLEQCKRVCS